MNPAFQQPAPDSLRAVLREVFAARDYAWQAPRRPLGWLEDLFEGVLDWLDALHVAHPVAYYLVLGAMTTVLVAIFAHLAYVIGRALRSKRRPDSTGAAAPVPNRDAAWHLDEARRLGSAARYAEALAHRFIALVLELDGRRTVQFRASKTPAEYVAEARFDDAGRSEFADLVGRLYHHVFGGAPCGPDDWGLFDRRASAVAAYHVATR